MQFAKFSLRNRGIFACSLRVFLIRFSQNARGDDNWKTLRHVILGLVPKISHAIFCDVGPMKIQYAIVSLIAFRLIRKNSS